jgi:O-acetyl-ADP-ribose deacetylase (regulator of RNase III)/uncharacterized protein YwgA
MFKALIGDLFASGCHTLVNTVNCVGIMGKGVAAEFKKRFPAMFDDYAARCDRKEVRLGEPYLYEDIAGVSIINFPTKGHWRSASRLSDIERGLDYLAAHASQWKLDSIALPPLGCGNGGLEWSEVGPLIHAKLSKLGIDVEIYAPFGTPKNQLTPEFLSGPAQLSLMGKGRSFEKMNPRWVVLMEVLRELGSQPYANPVGRVIFQKICYVVTEMGVDTGFKFAKGSYGPFAQEVKDALHDFANRNWVRETQLGKMMALRVGPDYDRDRVRFEDIVTAERGRIAKTVDLFSRIKSTDQAEEVTTVLFASKQLKGGDREKSIDDTQLLNYILEWKKAWQVAEKQQSVRETIFSLVALGWMKASLRGDVLQH